MRALQLHYTSCRRGQSGNSGFQTRSLTPGIQTAEQREIERRGVYRPPRDARQEPSEEEIARDFPRAVRWYTLESGRQALSRCCYTGRDYSGRWGNFFAHTLVVENGDFPASLWPIDFYEWEGWQERLSPAEDGDSPPPQLPTIDLASIAPAESFRPEELSEFLREEPGRQELLAKMGRAVLLGRDSSRALVIRDTPTRGLYWVACLQKLFPPIHSRALSYSTYQDDPRGCANVNATTGETDFTFDETERRFRFYMFDLTTGQHSDVPTAEDDYPAVAARWLAEEPGALAAFCELMELFNHRQPGPELIAAAHLFELSRGSLLEINGDRLSAMIAFAASHVTSRGKAALVEILGRAVEQTGANLGVEDYTRLIGFLSEGACMTGKPEHRDLVFGAWMSLLSGPGLRDSAGLAATEAAWRDLHRLFSKNAQDLAARLLAETVRRNEEAWQHEPPLAAFLFLLRATWESLELTGRIPPWQAPEVENLLRALVRREGGPTAWVQAVLDIIPGEPEPLAAVILQIRNLLSQGRTEPETRAGGLALGRALSRTLEKVPPGVAPLVRRQLESAKLWDVLLGEWADLCETADDPVTAFERYQVSVFHSLPVYEESCLPWAATLLLDKLPEPRRAALALAWLKSRQVDRFPDKLAGRCVSLANQAVPLDMTRPESGEVAHLVTTTATRLAISLRPDRPLLLDSLASAQSPQGELKDLRLARIRDEAVQLSADEYLVFLAGFLSPALRKAGSWRDHQQVLLATFNPSHAKAFQKFYLEFFKEPRKAPWPESLHGALRFWLAFDSRAGDGVRCLADLEETGWQGLLLALGGLQPKSLTAVRQKLHSARFDPRVGARWEEMQAALEKRKKGTWSRLVGIFVRQ